MLALALRTFASFLAVAAGLPGVAHAQALRAILKSEADGEYRRLLTRLLASVERGEKKRPAYRRQ